MRVLNVAMEIRHLHIIFIKVDLTTVQARVSLVTLAPASVRRTSTITVLATLLAVSAGSI